MLGKKRISTRPRKRHGELVEAVMVAVKSVQGRALMFEAYLPEYGAVLISFHYLLCMENRL